MRTQPVEQDPDVIVVGGGPVGCVAALAFARRGARVLVIEASSEQSSRFAGEWLHPPAAEILSELGALPEDASPHRGFVVFPDDATGAIVLEYAGDSSGRTCEHRDLVGALRSATAIHAGVCFRTGARVTNIRGQTVSYRILSEEEERFVSAGLIVGADGRASIARRSLGILEEPRVLSSMAGFLLEDVELPYEGFGHVVLGGPGPVLLYRLAPGRVRACLDVPLENARTREGRAALWARYEAVLPQPLRTAFRRATDLTPPAWAANQFRRRSHYGRPGLALVGDAVGHFHPLTAVGMTLGFQDAVQLARSETVGAYERERNRQSQVAERLASGLYRALAASDETAEALRQAIYLLWRNDGAERHRTMRYLSGQETDAGQFRASFFKVVAGALETLVRETAASGEWRRTPRVLRNLGAWIRWPNLSTLPRAVVEGIAAWRSFRRPA